jgi:dTMP kinase
VLIVLEGIDGAGKSTVARELASRLRDRGLDILETCEPTQSSAGLELRRLLAQSERTSTAEEELALFEADRAEHVQKLVRPALESGRWVLQDRTFYSTAAYQGARGMDVEEILRRSRQIAPEPDLTLWLELDPETGLERIRKGREALSSFERLEAMRGVDRIYRSLHEQIPTMVRIDARQPLARILLEAEVICQQQLPLPPRIRTP